jgi:hypothetical protein
MNVSRPILINLRLAFIFTAFIFPLVSSCRQDALQNAKSASVYFTLQDGNLEEIWTLPLAKNMEQKVLYRLTPAHIDFVSAKKSNLMTERFMEELQSRLDRLKDDNTDLQIELHGLVLSPDKTLLAWNEYLYQPPGRDLVQSTIKIMRISDQSIVATYSTFGAVEYFSWSPDSKYVLFHRTTDNDLQISLLDVSKSTVVDISLGSEPVFSPKGGLVFAEIPAVWPNGVGCCQIINISTGAVEKKEIDNHNLLSRPFPSPDGKYITLFAKNQNGIPSLVMMGVDTNEVQTFPVQFVDTNIIYSPQWSPAGDQIAMTIFNPNPSLVVLNKDSGKITLQFQMDGVAEWEWSDNGEQILILKLNYGKSKYCTVSSAQLGVLSLKDKSITPIDLPVSVYESLHQELFKYICPPGLAWIAW